MPGHGGTIELADGNLYLAIALRNGGSGLAVLHGWRAEQLDRSRTSERPPLDDFRRQGRDLYIPGGDIGFWQGAIRDRDDPFFQELSAAAQSGQRVTVDLLYGDHEGGQRTIARFGVGPDDENKQPRAEVVRYWSLDRDDPR